jgi:hypothetical protein
MKGKYSIKISNKRVEYNFTVERNITILRGFSATGKTEMINMVAQYDEQGVTSGVKIISDRACKVLRGSKSDIGTMIKDNAGCIFFMDENLTAYMKTNEFAEFVRNADAYFILVTRDDLPNLPYSVKAIKYMHSISNINSLHEEKYYNRLYDNYADKNGNETLKADIVVTEDTNSGYQFFTELYKNSTIKCIAGGGKSNICNVISSLEDVNKVVVIVVDGAAFGANLSDTLDAIRCKRNLSIVLYLPESFEALLFEAGVLKCKTGILEQTWNYVESQEYFSWERYFTALAIKTGLEYGKKYNKSDINEWYYSNVNKDKVNEVLPNILKI